MKTCRRCQTDKPYAEFRADARYAAGYGSWCKPCHRERNASWVKENRGRQSARVSAWRKANPEAASQVDRRYKAANKHALAKRYATWAAANRDKRRLTDATRKSAKLRATPSWADKGAMRAIYAEAVRLQRETGVRMHVDHIVPLQSPIVCGLHCEANLQILPGAANESKRNSWWPDMPPEAYRQPRLFDEPPPKPTQDKLFGDAA